MILLQQGNTSVDFQATAQSARQTAPSSLVAKAKPARGRKTVYRFERSVLPIEGGQLLLRLTQVPRVQLDHETLDCEVIGWDVKIPASHAQNIPREMARRFLELFSKADAGILTEQEQALWLSVLSEVDFQRFSIDRAFPQYLEGTILRIQPECRVEWHDGSVDKISPEVARSLSVLHKGDQFGAYVKLGRDNEVCKIERVVLL